MYTSRNFKTKKALKEAVAAYLAISPIDGQRQGRAVTYYQPGPFGGNEPRDGSFCLEGPHYPEAHKWYAQATAKDGVIIAVK